MVGVCNLTESTSAEKDILLRKRRRYSPSSSLLVRDQDIFAPSLQTPLLRRSVFQSGAVQIYPDLALGHMNDPLYLNIRKWI